MALKSRGLSGSRDKFKTFYLHYHNAYGCQTWHGSDLPWEAPKLRSHDPLITCPYKITRQTKIISSLSRSLMTTILGRLVTYLERFLSIYIDIFRWPFNHVILRDHITKIYISTHLRPIANMARWWLWLTMKGFYSYIHITF